MEKFWKVSVVEIVWVRCDMECFENEFKDVEYRIKIMIVKMIIVLKEKEWVFFENFEK